MQKVVTKIKAVLVLLPVVLLSGCGGGGSGGSPDNTPTDRQDPSPADVRPNFLFIITDDQSAAHTGKAGYAAVATPNFDRLANEGVYFANAFAAAPTCTASRSAILSGQHIWRLKSSALLWGAWSDVMVSYQAILTENGYRTGFTGKGWGPGHAAPPGYLGNSYLDLTRDLPPTYSETDYVANFRAFLEEAADDRPFSFWMGIREPHRPLKNDDSSRFDSLDPDDYLPDHLPKTADVDNHLQGYLEEIEQIDRDIGATITLLEEKNLLDNTLVVITSDNGMPFARAKMNNYLLGVQVPLLVYWPDRMSGQRDVPQVVSLTDMAPTFLAAAGLAIPPAMTGVNLLPLITERDANWDREEVFAGFERHNYDARPEGTTYSRRSLHQQEWLYIRNHFPDRWPLGDPPVYRDAYVSNFRDATTGEFLQPYLGYSVNKRPFEELYHLPTDPFQLNNLASESGGYEKLRELAAKMDNELSRTEDPVHLTGMDPFSRYEYWKPDDDAAAGPSTP